MTRLTPYDTGDRLEARPWIPYGTEVTDSTPADNFGKVDFDDDEGMTQAVVSSQRLDDGYMLIIEDLVTEETHLVYLKREEQD